MGWAENLVGATDFPVECKANHGISSKYLLEERAQRELGACRAFAARDWQDTDIKAMSSYFFQLFSFCFSSSGFALASHSFSSLPCAATWLLTCDQPRLLWSKCTGMESCPGASATPAGWKEEEKGISRDTAGSLCVLLVCGVPILLTRLGMAEGEEPWAPHMKPVVLQVRRSWWHPG